MTINRIVIDYRIDQPSTFAHRSHITRWRHLVCCLLSFRHALLFSVFSLFIGWLVSKRMFLNYREVRFCNLLPPAPGRGQGQTDEWTRGSFETQWTLCSSYVGVEIFWGTKTNRETRNITQNRWFTRTSITLLLYITSGTYYNTLMKYLRLCIR